MAPDPKWLDALNLPLKASFAGALAATLLIAAEAWAILDLGPLGPYARLVLILLAVAFWCLVIVGVANFLVAPVLEMRRRSVLSTRRAVRRQEQEEQREAGRRVALARLDHLSAEEIHHVADCLRRNTPTFYAWAHDPAAAVLIGKNLLWSPGSVHHRDYYPYTFKDDAWAEILRRREEFIAKDGANNPPNPPRRGRR